MTVAEGTRAGHDWEMRRIIASRMGRYTHEAVRSGMERAFKYAPPNLSVLDVGGGDGHHSLFVRTMGYSPVLLEYSAHPLEVFARDDTGIPAVQASGLELPIRASVFDIVMTIEVGVCMTGKDDSNSTFFAEVNRVLKPGGFFIATAHNRRSYVAWLKRLLGKTTGEDEMHYSDSLDDYARKLDAAGFDLVRSWGWRWVPATRDSNSRLVPVWAFLEKALGLGRLTGVSPWLFIVARKRRGGPPNFPLA